MALFDTTWYVNSVGWTAVTAWATGTAKAAGALIRQTAPAVNAERVFVCIVAGTTHATTQPTWTNTRGAKNTDNTVTWQECTGASAVNGDVTNTPASSTVRSQVITLGAIIKNNSATHYFICSTSGTAGAGEPTYNTTAGATTTDSTTTWTCIGAVGAFTGGQAPHARLANSLLTTWGANNNTHFVGNNHAETQAASLAILGVNSENAPTFVLCHNAAGNYPPQAADLTTGATITTTGANAISIDTPGMYFEGLEFRCGSGAVNTSLTIGNANGLQRYKNCSFQKLGTTATGAAITCGDAYSELDFNNCTVKFGATGDSFRFRRSRVHWKNTPDILAAGSSVPSTSLFTSLGNGVRALFEGVGLHDIAGTLVTATEGDFLFKDCKLHASVTIVDAASAGGKRVDLIRSASGATNNGATRVRFGGTETTELTIVRTGGASDGTVLHARKIVAASNAKYLVPFEALPISIWNDTTGAAKTLTVYGIWAGPAVPDNDDIWIDVEYLGSAASPIGSFVSSGKATQLTTAAAYASDGSTWGGSTTAFKMSVTFTPEMKGPVTVYVKVGLASTTFYFDPKVEIA